MNRGMNVKSFTNEQVKGMRALTQAQIQFLVRANRNINFSDDAIWNALKSGEWENINPESYGANEESQVAGIPISQL